MSPDDDRIAALESDVGDVKERLGRLEGQAARVEGAWWLVKRVAVITAALLTIWKCVGRSRVHRADVPLVQGNLRGSGFKPDATR